MCLLHAEAAADQGWVSFAGCASCCCRRHTALQRGTACGWQWRAPTPSTSPWTTRATAPCGSTQVPAWILLILCMSQRTLLFKSNSPCIASADALCGVLSCQIQFCALSGSTHDHVLSRGLCGSTLLLFLSVARAFLIALACWHPHCWRGGNDARCVLDAGANTPSKVKLPEIDLRKA